MSKIAILHYSAPPVIGGVENTIYHHSRLLLAAGHDVVVIAGRGERFLEGVGVSTIPEADSRHPLVLECVRELAQGLVSENFNKLRDLLILQLRLLLSEIDVCIVHNVTSLHKNMPFTAALHQLAKENTVPMIAWCHDFAWQDMLYLPDLHPGYPWDLLRQPWSGMRYVVVSTHRQERLAELLDISSQSIQVVTPGVDIEDFLKLAQLTRRLVRQLNLLQAHPLMLLPARVTKRKNIELAVNVTAHLRAWYPQAALVVTGPPGPHNPKNQEYLHLLNQLKGELGVSDAVHFLYEYGQENVPLLLPDEVIADFYRLADLLFFPSFREGFGIPVLEAGMARLPIFAADIPSIRQSSQGHAVLFDPHGDPREIALSIAACLDHDQQYQLRRRVIDHFAWEAIVQGQLIPLIQEVSI